MKNKKVIKIIGILLLLTGLIASIYLLSITKLKESKTEKIIIEKIQNKEEYFAIIDIPKINLKRELYEINDSRNNVDKNILVHKSSRFPENIVLAAHSGNKSNAYFKYLYKLKIQDIIKIYYQDKIYEYEVNEIEEQNKTGELYIKEDNNERLILITCTKNNNKTQMIYYSKLISIKDIK